MERRNFGGAYLAKLRSGMGAEEIVATCDFTRGPVFWSQDCQTWVVGTSSLWVFPLRMVKQLDLRRITRGPEQNLEPGVSPLSIPLSGVQTVVRARGKSLRGKDRLTLTIVSSLGQDTVTTGYAEGPEFADALDRATNRQHSLHHGPAGIAEDLARLAELHAAGIVSDEDLSRAKDLLFGKPPDAQQRAMEQLSQLHSLWRQGVLSESEFNSKKWEVLSRSPR